MGKSSVLYDCFSPDQILVISADSMQVYRDLNIVSATPSSETLGRYEHCIVNDIDPSDNFSVHEFLAEADRGVHKAHETGRIPVVVGGTGLYLNSFLFGLDEMPPKDPTFRKRLRSEAEEGSRQQIHDRLAQIDPESADEIHPNDLKRTIRALEIHKQTGKTKSELVRENFQETLRKEIDPTIIGLRRPADELQGRIRQRIERMIERGLCKEIDALRKEWDVSQTIKQAIGYPETLQFLDGKMTESELIDQIAKNTWQLVRNQRNWFKKFPVELWYHPDKEREQLTDHLRNLQEAVYET